MNWLGQLRGSLAWNTMVQFKREIVWMLAISLIVNLLMLTPTLYMMQIYDRVLSSQSLLSLLIISITILSLMLWLTYAQWIRSKVLVILGNKIEYMLSDRLFDACLKRYLKDKNIEPSQYLRALVEFKQFLAGMAVVGFLDIIWSPIFIVVAFMLHPILGWVSLAIVAVQLTLIALNHYQTKAYQAKKIENATENKRFIHHNLRSLIPIHVMGFTQHFKSRWLAMENMASEEAELSRRAVRPLQSAMHFFRYATQTISLGLGAYLAVKSEISVGSMIAANMIIARVVSPFDQVGQIWPQWMAFLKGNQLLTPLFSDAESIPSADKQATAKIQSIQVKNFSAKYNEDQENIIKTVSFDLRAGEVVAVMGPSGSGKTSLVKALMSLLPVTSGEIQAIYSKDDSPQKDLNDINVGYLPQDFQLFEGTVAENIARFGELDSTAITEAAMLSGVHDWVLRLPKGYDTMIGHHGMSLSGGQRQQLGLARAVYQNSSFVVLDEPNSNLDEIAEQALHKLLIQTQTTKCHRISD